MSAVRVGSLCYTVGCQQNFTGEKRERETSSIDQHYENTKTSNFFFCRQNMLTEGVSVTRLSVMCES